MRQVELGQITGVTTEAGTLGIGESIGSDTPNQSIATSTAAGQGWDEVGKTQKPGPLLLESLLGSKGPIERSARARL